MTKRHLQSVKCTNSIDAGVPKALPAVIRCLLHERMYVANAIRKCDLYAVKK